MISTDQSNPKSNGNIISAGLNKLKNLIQTNTAPGNNASTVLSAKLKEQNESYHAWGVRWCGNAGGLFSALAPALQSCYTQNVKEQKNDNDLQKRNQENLKSQIQTKKGLRDGEEIKLNSKQREKERFNEDISKYTEKIDQIKSSDNGNIMAKVNFTIGSIITILLAGYLFVFYSSASFSAFFGNNDISSAGEAILDSHCYAEAVANGLGQLLFILLMPVIFLGLGFLIHQFGESEEGWSKYLKIGCLYIVTFIFDALLAFEISEKVFNSTVIDDVTYTVSLAFNSPSFWIVIFSGFVAYVIWGLVFDFTLEHFDNMNAHTKEIRVLEDKIRNTKIKIEALETEICQIQQNIRTYESEISSLEIKLRNQDIIDTNILKNALSDFYNGWIAYMTLVRKSNLDMEESSKIYNQFISQI